MEVHPPEHPIHTWRDFLIHIATIVVGLIIAVGLEQLVVLIEHHHEIRETRERLKTEREANIRHFHKDMSNMRDTAANLRGDVRVLQYLQAHPGTPSDQLPGVPRWVLSTSGIETSAWDWFVKAPVFELLPQSEIEPMQRLYGVLQDAEATHMRMWDCLNEAGEYRFTQPDISKLTPQQIDTALTRSQACLRLTFQYAVVLSSIARGNPDFAPGPSDAELDSFASSNSVMSVSPTALDLSEQDRKAAHAWEAYDIGMLEFMQTITRNGFNGAGQTYDTIARKYPGFRPEEATMNDLGYAQLNGGHLPQAVAIFQLNARLNPQSWNAFDSLGEAYRKSGDTQQAIASYEKSMQLNPRNSNGARALTDLRK